MQRNRSGDGKTQERAALSARPDAQLLDIVAQLVRDSRPGDSHVPLPTLDSTLEGDLGIDSLARVELLLRVERAFDVRLPDRLLASAETPRGLLRALLAGTARAAEALAITPIVQPDRVVAPEEARTLVEALDWHVARHPDRLHVMVLPEGNDGAGEPMTYGQLRTEAQAVANGLGRRGIGGGQSVALMLPTGRDFFRAFTGVLLAGAVPVPIYPPARPADAREHLRRQSRILDNCRASLLVTTDEDRRIARVMKAFAPTLGEAVSVEELSSPTVPALLPALNANDLALLQYTSGSTGDPKGVMLTHANLLANIRAMGSAVRAVPDDVFVSWLPLYHDMGLIGAWMGGLYFAFPLVVMPPSAFLNRPTRWLRAIHRFRGTLSSAPNFAYEICATRMDPRDLAGLDLSSWRLAFNGSEPVSADTLERFANRFTPYGLPRDALAPVYGLAECSVGLTFPPLGRVPLIDCIERRRLSDSGAATPVGETRAALRMVSCGVPLPGHEIRVIDRDGRELPERVEGRIEFRGPSATSGYFRNAMKTRELFDGDWLDTGDVGYVAGGELFLTSRAKDVIIRGGQHVHPYEVEEAVGRLPGVRKGCVAVFGVPNTTRGSEKVVVLAESRLAAGPAREALRESIRQVALALLGTPPDDVAIVAPHTVLKTSSGKVRRAASRDAYLAGREPASRGWFSRGKTRFLASLAVARARRLMRRLSALGYGAYAWSVAALIGIAALPVAALPVRVRWRALRALARTLLHASGIPFAAQGLEAAAAMAPLVIVANHASYIDGPLLFALLPRPVRFVAKRELARNPIVHFLLRAAGVVFIERFDVERGAKDARTLTAIASERQALVFFAEGTFTRAPGLLPFHMGAFVAAAASGAPVLPIVLRGTRSVLRDGQWLPRRVPIVVRAAPLQIPDGDDWAAAARLRDRVRATILADCGEPDFGPSSPRVPNERSSPCLSS